MIDAEKHYKHTLDRKYKKYRKKFSEDIQNLSKNNSKEFWKLLNKGKTKKQPNIEIDKLYDFFSKFVVEKLNV
jgi:catalase (peroxidase I)